MASARSLLAGYAGVTAGLVLVVGLNRRGAQGARFLSRGAWAHEAATATESARGSGAASDEFAPTAPTEAAGPNQTVSSGWCRDLWLNEVARVTYAMQMRMRIHANTKLGLQLARETLLFIHVGKAGGGSVGSQLKDNRVPYAEVHVHPVLPMVVRDRSMILISIRDPISRVLASFNNELDMRPERMRELTACFSNMEAAVQALRSAGPNRSSCERAAHKFLAPRSMAPKTDRPGDSLFGGHISKGPCFYMGGLLPMLEGRPVWLARQESLEEDMRGFADAWLRREIRPPKRVHKGTFAKSPNMTYLSDSSLAYMRHLLNEEYELVAGLERIALNGRGRVAS